MKIIISPAKTINIDEDYVYDITKAPYYEKTAALLSYLKGLSYEELKGIWKCNDKLAKLNYERIMNMELDKNTSSALFAYEGLQYQYLSAKTLELPDMEYLEKHLRVLSGFYGIVKPSTGICAYRLEMQARIDYEGYDNLYDYWAEDIVKELTRDGDKEILNLASKEYSKCVYRYEKSEALSIKDVDFCEIISGKAKQKATLAKMARGELVRLMAKQQITDLEKIKKLKILDFEYCKERSDDKHFVFVRNRA